MLERRFARICPRALHEVFDELPDSGCEYLLVSYSFSFHPWDPSFQFHQDRSYDPVAGVFVIKRWPARTPWVPRRRTSCMRTSRRRWLWYRRRAALTVATPKAELSPSRRWWRRVKYAPERRRCWSKRRPTRGRRSAKMVRRFGASRIQTLFAR